MTEKFLIDTNLFVYAYDESDKKKQEKCAALLDEIFAGTKKAYVGNQILAETYFVLAEKTGHRAAKEDIQLIIGAFIASSHLIKINYGANTIIKAIELSEKFSVHFWDALIAATMIENNVSTIYTENEKDFKKIPGLEVINPLS